MTLGEPIRVVRMVAEKLEKLNIPYAVVGSLASSVYGIPRSTQDVDVVAAMMLGDVDAFVEGLRDDFYVSSGMIEEAIEHRSSFNVIHLNTMLKVDVFVVTKGGLTGKELERAEIYAFDDEENTTLRIASAEDIWLSNTVTV
ncbi:MAG: hypothetical protein ACLFWL_08600 [Candidatus Brocadiia bacterium]